MLLAGSKRVSDKVLNFTVTNKDSLPTKQLSSDINKMRKDVVKAVRNIPQAHISAKGPIDLWIKTGQSWTEFINKQ
jgi:hypothetical protein